MLDLATTRWARVLCIGLASTMGGCSFFFVHPPRTGSGYYGQVSCTSNPLAPTLDVMFTGFQVARTLIAVNASDQDYQGMALSRGGDIGLGVALTMLGAASAAYGFSSIKECKERGGGGGGAGTVVGPQPQRTHAQRAAEEAAEEAAVQTRMKARAAAAATAAQDAADAGATDGPDRGR